MSPPSRPGFRAGVRAVGAGLRFVVTTPGCWPAAAVPPLILGALAGLGGATAARWVQPWVTAAFGAGSTGYWRVGAEVLGWVAAVLAALVAFFVALVLTPPLSGPALERLVARREAALGAPPRAPLGVLAEMGCGLRAAVVGASVAVPLLALCFAIDFAIPGAAIVTTPVKIAVTAFSVSWNLLDYPLTLRGVGMRRRLAFARRHWRATAGFGLALAALFLVPCCGVVLLGVGAAAATDLLWALGRADPEGLAALGLPASGSGSTDLTAGAAPTSGDVIR